MPEVVACPNCERNLRVPVTLLGKRVKCPACQTAFTAVAAREESPRPRPAPAERKTPPVAPRRPVHDDDGPERYDVVVEETPAEDDEGPPKQGLLEKHLREQILDERSKRGKRPFAENWRKARVGLRIVSLAAFILVANLLVQTAGRGIVWFITKPEDPLPTPTPQQIETHKALVKQAEADKQVKQRYLSSATAIIYLVHQIVALVGIGLCLLSPDKNQMRLLVAAALLFGLLSLGLEIGVSLAPLQYLISGSLDAQGNIPPPHPALKITTDLAGYLRFFVFLFFMRAVAVTTKSDDLKRDILFLMFSFGGVILFWTVMAAITAAKLLPSTGLVIGAIVIEGSVIGVLGTGSLALVLAGVFWFTMTVYSTTVAITDWLRER